MSVVGIDGFRTSLARQLRPQEGEIRIPRAQAIRLNAVGIGNHTYLTIWDQMKTEVVRYDHVADWDTTDPAVVALPVARDISGLGARSFAFGTCVEYRVTSFFVQDLVPSGLNCMPAGLPATSEGPELPTTVVGGREVLMGNPAGFIELCPGQVVPYYTPVP